ncbi:MAG TPA: methyltransferase domain-containing protein [Bacteroidota bacterium]|nr:methyltransferase domain-containing protein [Bacteroidota bacterium]
MTERAGQKKGVREFFDSSPGWRGDFYREPDDPFGQLLVRRKRHVMTLLRRHIDPSHGLVFDAGCGPGEYLAAMAREGARVYGMDASEEMLRAAAVSVAGSSDPGSGPPIVRGDIERLPFRAGRFSAALCIGVLGYLESDRPALSELHTLLESGGYLLVNVRNLNALTSFHYTGRLKLRYLRREGWKRLRSAVSLPTHGEQRGWKSRAYNLRKFERVIRDSGFERVEAVTFGYELKVLSLLGVRGTLRVRIEILVENIMMALPFGAGRYAGWGYIGVFRKVPRA